MSNIDKQALEKAAEKALQGKWDYEAGAIWNTDESGMVQHMAAVEAGDDISDEEHKSNMRFITLATPAVVLGLLDELYKSKATEANESNCANSVIDSAIKWQTRAKDAEAKLEAAEKKTVEMPTFDGYVPHVARELQAAFRIACDNAGINVAAATGKGEAS
ncbi:ead/Ea22-like family protein [Enterobacter ludwigii]|uniref:ead/Ea22-like family protein n=1 Tax=Enterobacter ludwigii TaxID=299767 RepID=UPI0024301B5F|nr:ead/Ea22-like family protein [Enterobacter ludwigii]WGA03118.1 ead/Ea22-like family protein [Enterobacter ludwigii]